MIECRVLGTLDLRDASDGRRVRSVLSQPKRVALLAYLAVATPRGPHRRDTLLALFWPESSEDRARNSLNQAVFKLRQSLGEGAIETLGDGALELGSEVWCDAVAFEEALDAGGREEALELYQGDLLPGFHVSECPKFERWLERGRARLRARAVEAALELARAEEEEENGIAAVHWLRQASSWAPYEEPVVRRLVELLGRLGDRAGAVREYRKFRERLERDLALEPSAETEAVVEEIGRRIRPEEVEADVAAGAPPAEEERDAAGRLDDRVGGSRAEASKGGGEASVPSDRGSRGRRWGVVFGVSLTAVALIVAAFQWLDPLAEPGGPADAASASGEAGASVGERAPWFEEQDAVLVADFENRTAESSLDGVLRPAFAHALANSPFVSVASRRRIADALRLMRLSPDTAVDARIGRRVALRDPGIRAVLTGTLREAEGTLVLDVQLIAPREGRVLRGWSEEVGRRTSQISAGVEEVSLAIREYLGETLDRLREEGANLERVTTSSLRALRLYDEAEAVIARYGMDATSEELLRDAIREDPDFASAHLLLFYAIRNQGRPWKEAFPHLERAMELADEVSDRERYFIRGAYFRFTGERQRAEANWRALLRLHPDHYWANSNLGHLLGGTEAIPFMVQKARYRPNDLDAAWDAAHALAIVGGRPEDARPYVDRVVELAEVEVPPQQHYEAAWARLWDAHRRWVAGDLEAARSELARWAEEIDEQSGSEARWSRRLLARGYRTVGVASRASELLPIPEERRERSLLRGLGQLLGDDLEGAVRRFRGEEWNERSWSEALLGDPIRLEALARSGRTKGAREILDSFRSFPRASTPDFESDAGILDTLMSAQLALAEARPGESARSLERLLERDWEHYGAAFFLTSQNLARAYRLLGRHRDALAVLEQAVAGRERSYPFGTELWMDTQLRLARLQRELGHTGEAGRLEAELRDLMQLADPDFWLVQELEKSMNRGVER